MRRVIVSHAVQERIDGLQHFLIHDLKLSEEAALGRIFRIRNRFKSLGNPGDYALCRFKRWREQGYRCIPSEGRIFAYKSFDEGVIIQDMAHGKALHDID